MLYIQSSDLSADLIWLCLDKKAVPSMHQVVLLHHVVTILLLLFPYTHPQYAVFTCLDGKRQSNLKHMQTLFILWFQQWTRSIPSWCWVMRWKITTSISYRLLSSYSQALRVESVCVLAWTFWRLGAWSMWVYLLRSREASVLQSSTVL